MPNVIANQFCSPSALAEIPAVILCGGPGTRLRSIVRDRPKSMALVGGRPFLEFLLIWLRESGVRDVILCTGYKSDCIREHFGAGHWLGVSLSYSEEGIPLGTGGALRHANHLISRDTFLVLNGDSVIDIDLERLILDHAQRNSVATMTLALTQQPERYGQVFIGDEEKVVAFAEKQAVRTAGQVVTDPYINAGVYVFQRKVLSLIPSAPPAVSLERSVMPQLIGNGLHGFRSHGYFVDIGVPEDFVRAQEEIPRRFGYVHSHTR